MTLCFNALTAVASDFNGEFSLIHWTLCHYILQNP